MFDMSKALRRVDDHRDVFERVVEFFFEDCPLFMSRIRDGFRAGDLATVSLAAHNLRRLLEHFDAAPAITLAADLEKYSKSGDLPAAAASFDRLKVEIDELHNALRPCRVAPFPADFSTPAAPPGAPA
jgi:hypothetical protein